MYNMIIRVYKMKLAGLTLMMVMTLLFEVQGQREYKATWESLNSRPIRTKSGYFLPLEIIEK